MTPRTIANNVRVVVSSRCTPNITYLTLLISTRPKISALPGMKHTMEPPMVASWECEMPKFKPAAAIRPARTAAMPGGECPAQPARASSRRGISQTTPATKASTLAPRSAFKNPGKCQAREAECAQQLPTRVGRRQRGNPVQLLPGLEPEPSRSSRPRCPTGAARTHGRDARRAPQRGG